MVTGQEGTGDEAGQEAGPWPPSARAAPASPAHPPLIAPHCSPLQVCELSLSANQLRSEVKRRRFRAGPLLNGSFDSVLAAAGPKQPDIECTGEGCNGELLVELRPMEVRTFELWYKPTE